MNAILQPSTFDQMRSEQGLKYERYVSNLKALINSSDPKAKAAVDKANASILSCKSTPGQVHIDQAMTSMSLMYANDDYIGERLMPVLYTGGKLSAKYFTYPKRERFAYPDDSASDRSSVNELNESRSSQSVSLEGRALKEWVGQDTLNNQDAPLNELLDAQQNVLEGLAFQRELRIAAIVGAAGSYGSNTGSPTVAWSAGGDPLGDIDTMKAACWNGRGPGRRVGFCSLAVWNVLKRHQQLMDTLKYGGSPGSPAQCSIQAFCQLVGIDDLLVSESRKDTANEGQASASYSRIWPDVFGIVRVSPPSVRNAAFGFTFRSAPIAQIMWFDQEPGVTGGYFTKASCHESHDIVAADTSYLLTSVL